MSNSKGAPSADEWLREAKADPSAAECGMYLIHNGTVRQSARARCGRVRRTRPRWRA